MEIVNANNYDVFIGALSETFVASSIDISSYSKPFILVDENTHEHCLQHLLFSVGGLEEAEIIEIPFGEENKTLEICYQIWMALTESGADRKSLLINLGGGVIGDMGGFVASTFKRGIDFIQIPTTLLAQVDASVGGKLGIDFEGYKNQIGVFAEPKAVFIDADFLETLDDRNIKSGFAEMIKHSLIADRSQWQKFQSLNIEPVVLSEYIVSSVEIKNKIVSQDFKEENIRKNLNFGHTVGHAVESLFLFSQKPFLHGEAIAIGIVVESILSLKIGLSENEFLSIYSFIKKHFYLPKISNEEMIELKKLVLHDKKNVGGQLKLTLLEAVGEAQFDIGVSMDEFENAIIKYNSLV